MTVLEFSSGLRCQPLIPEHTLADGRQPAISLANYRTFRAELQLIVVPCTNACCHVTHCLPYLTTTPATDTTDWRRPILCRSGCRLTRQRGLPQLLSLRRDSFFCRVRAGTISCQTLLAQITTPVHSRFHNKKLAGEACRTRRLQLQP